MTDTETARELHGNGVHTDCPAYCLTMWDDAGNDAAPTRYGVTTDYDYNETHKRERLLIWSGAWFSVYEGAALSLPKGDGYMVTTYNGDKVRVTCPTPRTDDNWQQIDAAINAALNEHHRQRAAVALHQPTD